ncbi:hypothetical protein JCM21900_005235 [Sporobolomyces salmonicolor]
MLNLDLRTLDLYNALLDWPAPGAHDVLIFAILYGLVALVTFLSDLAHAAVAWTRTPYRCHQCGGAIQRPLSYQHVSVIDNVDNVTDSETDDEFAYEADGSVVHSSSASLDLLGGPSSFGPPPFASDESISHLHELVFFVFFLQLLRMFEPVVAKDDISSNWPNFEQARSPEYITLGACDNTSRVAFVHLWRRTPAYHASRSSQSQAIETDNPRSFQPSSPSGQAVTIPSTVLSPPLYIATSTEGSPPSRTVEASFHCSHLRLCSVELIGSRLFAQTVSDIIVQEIVNVSPSSPTPSDSLSSATFVHRGPVRRIHLRNSPRRLPVYSQNDSLSDVPPCFLRHRLLDQYLWKNIAAADAAKEKLKVGAVEQAEVSTGAVRKSWADYAPEDDEEYFASLPTWEKDEVTKQVDTVASAVRKSWAEYAPEDDEEYFASLPVWEEDEVTKQVGTVASAVRKSWADYAPEDDEEYFASLPVWEEDEVTKQVGMVGRAVRKSWADYAPEDDEEYFASLPVWEEDGVTKQVGTVASAVHKSWVDYAPEDDEEYFATLPVWEDDEVP